MPEDVGMKNDASDEFRVSNVHLVGQARGLFS